MVGFVGVPNDVGTVLRSVGDGVSVKNQHGISDKMLALCDSDSGRERK